VHSTRFMILAIVIGGALAATACVTASAVAADLAASPAPAAAAAGQDAVLYNNAQVPIDQLFKNYQVARTELEAATAKAAATRDKLAEVQRRVTGMQNDVASAERPIRAELTKNISKQRDYQKALAAKAPVKPTARPLPPQPRAPTNSGNTGYGSGTGYNSGTSPTYQNQLAQWQAQVARIQAEDAKAQQDYQKALADFQKAQTEAKAEGPKVDAAILEAQQKIAQLEAGLKVKQAPIMDEQKAAVDVVKTADMDVAAVKTRIDAMAEALRAAPDGMRIRHSLVEWKTFFYLLPELEKLYVDTQVEINRVTEKLKDDGIKAGMPLPDGWRHPQQDDMDALKVVLTKARGGQPPVLPPPAPAATPTATAAPTAAAPAGA